MNKKKMIGTFSLNTCPIITEIISRKLDFVILDREHGPYGYFETNVLNKIVKNNAMSFIRVSNLEKIEIQRCLDLNPHGILVPQISSYEDARLAIEYTFFSPVGKRGVSPYTAAFSYHHSDSEKKKSNINNNLFLGLLIEGKEGLDSLEKILKKLNRHISLIYFGLYDFASSLGLKPDWKDKELVKALSNIIKLCKKNRVRVGTIARDFTEISFLKKIGINFICFQNDTGIIHEAFEKINKHSK